MKFNMNCSKLLLCACLLSGISSVSHAQTNLPTGNRIKYQVPLKQFMIEDEQIVLKTTYGEYSVYIPIADRLDIQSALLHLEYVNSISLLEERSQIRVLLNEQVIAQAPLRRNQPEGSLDIRLPKALLKAGHNRLRFIVAQHFTLKCEDPSAPELWTQINTETSTLSFEAMFRPLQPSLSQLEELFDSKRWGSQQLNMVVPSALEGDLPLKWGTLVAQGVALRLDYLPLHISHSNTLINGEDNILIGTSAQLRSLLPTEQMDAIQGSYLAVLPLPGNASNFLMVVSGRDDAEVTRAATAFCHLNFPLPDAPSMVIKELIPPEVTDLKGRLAIRGKGQYRFSQLGFSTTTFKGINRAVNSGVFRFDVNLPGDMYADEDSQVKLFLHFAHGASFRKDSVLNIAINDVFQNAIPLNSDSGAAYRDYEIAIPLRSFRPGPNTLKVSPQMVPLITDFCTVIQEENLLFTLFDDSRLVIPSASHFAQLPDLGLFSRSLFPFSAQPDGSGLSVHVLSKDSSTVSAAWTLLGKLAQKTGFPMRNVEISFQPASSRRHLMVVGALNQIPAEIMKAASLGGGEINRFLYSQKETRLREEKDLAPASYEGPNAEIQAITQLGRYGAAMEFESPHSSQKVVFLLTAQSAPLLAKRVSQLIQPEFWNSMRGDLTIWSDEPASLRTQQAGKTYNVGSMNPRVRLEYHFSKHPWFWIATIVGVLLIFAVLTRKLLGGYKTRHHGDKPEVHGDV